MAGIGLTNFHCHTNVDWVCEPDLTPATYAAALGGPLRRAVITDHGFMYYWYDRETVFRADWMIKPELFDKAREWGNGRLRANIDRIRGLNDPNVFAGIETDLMRDGRLTHDPCFTDEFDVIICSAHFLPWIGKELGEPELLREVLGHIEKMVWHPEVDILGHPFRWLVLTTPVKQVRAETLRTLAEMIEQSGVAVEFNLPKGKQTQLYETVSLPLLRLAADRGLPVTFGTDAHRKADIANFALHMDLLAKAGLSTADLNMLEVEDFLARKGRRNSRESRPRGRGAGKSPAGVSRPVPAPAG